jgi:hypothetical protein
VISAFDHLPGFQNKDFVCRFHRGKPVGDHQRGAALRGLVERFLNGMFGCAVEGRGRFVQHEDGGGCENDAGDADALFLAAGELQAAFADAGVPAFGQAFDEFEQLGPARGVATSSSVASGRA